MEIVKLGVKEFVSNKLYHKEIGFPSDIHIPTGHMDVSYSRHALDEANSDKYGGIDLPDTINFQLSNVIEIEVDSVKTDFAIHNRIIKMVVRVPYDEEKDLVLALIPSGADNAIVKTVWFNTKGDVHRTLNRSRYTNPRITRW